MSKIKFAYIRDTKSDRVLTIARLLDFVKIPGYIVIRYAAALVNPDDGDKFCKKIGRDISSGRLIKGLYDEIDIGLKEKSLPVIVNDLSENDPSPTVRRMCRAWLKEAKYLELVQTMINEDIKKAEKEIKEKEEIVEADAIFDVFGHEVNLGGPLYKEPESKSNKTKGEVLY